MWDILFAVSDYFLSIFRLFSLYGISLSILEVSQPALISELSPSSIKSTGLGIYNALVNLGSVFANVVVGILLALYFFFSSFCIFQSDKWHFNSYSLSVRRRFL